MDRLIAVCVLVLLTGCIQPGKDTATALKQEAHSQWSADGQFSIHTVGSQEGKSLMMEGQLKMVENEDGEMVLDVENSTITHYLLIDPSAEEAGSLGAAFAQASVEQTKAVASSFDAMIKLVAPIVSQGLLRPAPERPDVVPP